MQSYGFQTPTFVQTGTFSNFQESYALILKRRYERWNRFIDQGNLIRCRQLKRYCRKGIPSEFRVRVWMKLSGAELEMNEHPNVYKTAADFQPVKTIYSTIMADLPRTFPENEYFCDVSNEQCLLTSLQRVLFAFAVTFPKIGYCQGLNYVAATLLLAMSGTSLEVEEKAFWLLHTLTHRIIPAYHLSGMVDVQTDCLVFEELLRLKVPNVYKVLKDAGVDCVVLATKWFICLFADVVPIETTLRIFDCLFYEGDKILFRACIALVKLHLEDIIKCHQFPDIILTFRNICKDEQTLYCHEFLKAMFSQPGTLSKSLIKTLRSQCQERVLRSMDEVNQRRLTYLANQKKVTADRPHVENIVIVEEGHFAHKSDFSDE